MMILSNHFETDYLRLSFLWLGLCFNKEEEANSFESYLAINNDKVFPHLKMFCLREVFADDSDQNRKHSI